MEGDFLLVKRDASGALILHVPRGLDITGHTVAGDEWGGAHLADNHGAVSRCDAAGKIWFGH